MEQTVIWNWGFFLPSEQKPAEVSKQPCYMWVTISTSLVSHGACNTTVAQVLNSQLKLSEFVLSVFQLCFLLCAWGKNSPVSPVFPVLMNHHKYAISPLRRECNVSLTCMKDALQLLKVFFLLRWLKCTLHRDNVFYLFCQESFQFFNSNKELLQLGILLCLGEARMRKVNDAEDRLRANVCYELCFTSVGILS